MGFMELVIIFMPLLIVLLFAMSNRQPASGAGKTISGTGKALLMISCGLVVCAISLILVTRLLAAPGSPAFAGGHGPSFLQMLVFLAIAALVVLALGSVVAMIVNPKTRPWGAGPVLLLGLFMVFYLAVSFQPRPMARPVKVQAPWDAPVVSLKPEPGPIRLDQDAAARGKSDVRREMDRIRAEIAKTHAEIQKARREISKRSGSRQSAARAKNAQATLDKLGADVKRAEAEMAAVAKRAATAKKDATGVKRTEPVAKPAPKSDGKPAPSDATAEATEPTRESASADDAPKDDAPKSDAPKETKAEPTDEPAASEDKADTSVDKAEPTDEASPPEDAAPTETARPVEKPAEPAAPTVEPLVAEKTVENTAEATSVAKRPDWIDAKPRKVGDEYQSVVLVGPYTTRLECDRAMLFEVRRAVVDYIDIYLSPEAKRRVRLSDDYVRERIVKSTWESPRESTVGPMVQLHVLLAFDRKTNDLIKQEWHDAQVLERVWQAGFVLAGVLIALAIVYGVLKMDVVTKGGARHSMLLVAGALALGAFGASVLLGCSRDDDAGMVSTFFGLPLLFGALFMIWRRRTRRFGWALLAGLALASLGWLRFMV